MGPQTLVAADQVRERTEAAPRRAACGSDSHHGRASA